LFAVTREHIRQIEAKALPEPRPHRAPTSSGLFRDDAHESRRGRDSAGRQSPGKGWRSICALT